MDGYQYIFDAMLDELTEVVLHDMADEPDVKAQTDTILKISTQIHKDPSLDAGTKARIAEYFDALQLLAGKQHKLLYLQGAKDFARLLRKFDIIK